MPSALCPPTPSTSHSLPLFKYQVDPESGVNINKPIDCGGPRPISHWSSITNNPPSPRSPPGRVTHFTPEHRALHRLNISFHLLPFRHTHAHTRTHNLPQCNCAPLIFPFSTSQSEFVTGDKGLLHPLPTKRKKNLYRSKIRLPPAP